MKLDSSSTSLFDGPSKPSRGDLADKLSQFEAAMWGNALQAMMKPQLGPDNLGSGGKMFRDMLMHELAQNEFADVDKSLTQAAMRQMVGPPSDEASASSAVGKLTQRAGAATTSTANTGSADGWVKSIWHAAKQGADQLGVPVRGILAQAALETGWGSRAGANNLFGIKAHSGNSQFTAATHEFRDGVMRVVHAAFQGYSSIEGAIEDYVDVIRRQHSGAIGQKTIRGFAESLQSSGYATDPRYAAKITAVATSRTMDRILSDIKN